MYRRSCSERNKRHESPRSVQAALKDARASLSVSLSVGNPFCTATYTLNIRLAAFSKLFVLGVASPSRAFLPLAAILNGVYGRAEVVRGGVEGAAGAATVAAAAVFTSARTRCAFDGFLGLGTFGVTSTRGVAVN